MQGVHSNLKLFALSGGEPEENAKLPKHIRLMQHKPRSGELWMTGGGAKRNSRIRNGIKRSPEGHARQAKGGKIWRYVFAVSMGSALGAPASRRLIFANADVFSSIWRCSIWLLCFFCSHR
jgi:hypothetical protein